MKPAQITDTTAHTVSWGREMFANREVRIRANLSYVFAESVAEASPSFPYVELRTFAA